MNNDINPEKIVSIMFENDLFSKWLGISVSHISKGKCILEMTVKKEMLNGFSIAHGGITYSLADSCLAFAANSHGTKCVSKETSINHLKKVNENDILIAKSIEKDFDKRSATYDILVTNQLNELVAKFSGIVHRTNNVWE